ncbi:MAG: M20 family metallopeptidase [Candidatus Thermoplasmatota archaeon]|nr:M20 family metallopeptidase [Candidatus Thermoplasmatota archaeon]
MIDPRDVDILIDQAVEVRRMIHSRPEVGMDTRETMNLIKSISNKLGFKGTVIENGIMIDSGKDPEIALRADMDALPIVEKTGLSFASSVEGVMHACGHDLHTAILQGVMNYVKSHDIPPVRFIFQPGEEIGQGAKMMINGGAMDGIQEIFGLHAWPSLNVGEYSIVRGSAMAAVDEFRIRVLGTGGHGAYPHLAFDTILEASKLVQSVLEIPARRVNPLSPSVVSIGYIRGGKTANVIPTEVEFGGTVRTHHKEDSAIIEKEIRSLYSEHVSIDYKHELPALTNDSEFAGRIENEVSDLAMNVAATPTMGGEDFSLYCQKGKCAFAFLGTGKINGREVSKHSSIFDVNEGAIKYGIILHLAAINAHYSKNHKS